MHSLLFEFALSYGHRVFDTSITLDMPSTCLTYELSAGMKRNFSGFLDFFSKQPYVVMQHRVMRVQPEGVAE